MPQLNEDFKLITSIFQNMKPMYQVLTENKCIFVKLVIVYGKIHLFQNIQVCVLYEY